MWALLFLPHEKEQTSRIVQEVFEEAEFWQVAE